MSRGILICSPLIFFLLAGSFVHAQRAKKVSKIGYLANRPSGPGGSFELFQRELRKLGYIEGKNIVFESRYADNTLERLPALASELARLRVDVLFAIATNEALAAKSVTKTIPIVFLSGSDPVAVGLIENLARPGGNVTGFTGIAAVLAGKRLELLKESTANLSRVALLWDSQNPGSRQQWQESQQPGKDLGLQLYSMEVSSANKYEGAFKDAIAAGSAALAVAGSQLAVANQLRIVNLAVKYRLPAIYPREDWVAAGGLMSYGPDRAEPYKRIAVMIDKILKGAKPADLPVEQPTKFELVINLKAAKQIGLTIPPNVLARANKVIK
ncbi:MAG: ABC transporter substrate-binding protein [Candidatus Binatia bacterium]